MTQLTMQTVRSLAVLIVAVAASCGDSSPTTTPASASGALRCRQPAPEYPTSGNPLPPRYYSYDVDLRTVFSRGRAAIDWNTVEVPLVAGGAPGGTRVVVYRDGSDFGRVTPPHVLVVRSGATQSIRSGGNRAISAIIPVKVNDADGESAMCFWSRLWTDRRYVSVLV